VRTLDDERDLEHSPLPGPFTRDGVTVEVETYRYAGTQDPWRLERGSSDRKLCWFAGG
jgi:hypothetical protein